MYAFLTQHGIYVYKHILFTLTRDQLLRQTKFKKIVTIDTAQVNIKEVMVLILEMRKQD